MEKRRFIYKFFLFIYIIIIPGLSGCIMEDGYDSGTSTESDPQNLFINFPTRGNGLTFDTDVTLDPLASYFDKEKSVLLIAQRTNVQSISFNDMLNDAANHYLYKYVWDGTEAQVAPDTPNWESGYNFIPYPAWSNTLNWETVISNGAFDNSYAFGALYFPVLNEQISSVATDQSNLESLMMSNILGTYHLTENLYERFRFKLYHVMACIRVTILVPEYQTNEESGATGFNEATVEGQLLGVQPNFTIDWGSRSSEEPPIVKNDETMPETADIIMYPHPVEGTREVVEYDLSDFGLSGNEKVREYTFTVLFPSQTISNTSNILRFLIMENIGTVSASYVWSTSQLSTNLQVSSGTVTNLILYFPRTENNALLIKSEILNWNQADTDVTLTPEINTK